MRTRRQYAPIPKPSYEDLVRALEHYADQYCEGHCKKDSDSSAFMGCGGCRARVALQPLYTTVDSTK